MDDTPCPEKPGQPFVLPDGQMALPGVTSREERYAKEQYHYQAARCVFVHSLPREVREELRRYAERKWHLLNLFARCPGALDLSRSNPGLAYALASNWAFHKPAVARPIRAARSLVHKKQKAILEWLGFPATEPARRILAKIRPKSLRLRS